MKRPVSNRAALAFVVVVLAGLAVGLWLWTRAEPPVHAGIDFYAPPTTPAAKVELYDAAVTELSPGTLRCEVRYRFLEGSPAAEGTWYCCLMEFPGSPGSYRRPLEARSFRNEGTLVQEVQLLRPGAETFRISLADARTQQGPYRRVSNVVSGAVDKPVPQVKEFSLLDTQGQKHSPAEWRHQEAIVLIFLATECPVSNGYAPEYARLEKAFRDKGVRFYGVHSDPDVTAKAAADHAREYHLTFPVLLDPTQVLAKQTGIAVTPEAVVLTPAGLVQYRGRIDDRYLLDGKRKDAAQTQDLEAALAAVLAGKKPPVAETKAYGCPLPSPGK